MNLKETIRQNMYSAMKAKNTEDKRVYAMMLDVIQKAEKEKKKDFTDDEIIPLIQKQIKQTNETLEFAKKGNANTLIAQCENEVKLLSTFLPQMMSEHEIGLFLDSVFEDIEPIKNNKGKVMKECAKLRSKADMKLVAQIVDSVLV